MYRSAILRRYVYLGSMLVLLGALALATRGSAITHGTTDAGHPNVGAILHLLPRGAWYEYCSGTLIAPQVFLTAGHCTDYFARQGWVPAELGVSFSPNLFQGLAPLIAVASYRTEPGFTGVVSGADSHDLGLIVLAEPVTDRGFASLAPLGYLDGLRDTGQLRNATFTNVGYGQIEGFLFTGERRVSYSGFFALLDSWLYMSQNPHLGDGGTCYGDSGGPTFYNDGTREYLVAVTSWGDAECIATNNNYRTETGESLAFLQGAITAPG